VLEEYAKLLAKSGAAFEAIRYDAYTLEKDFASPPPRPPTLDDKRLMVLVGTSQTKRGTPAEVVRLTREILRGGCRLIELREKTLSDAAFLALACELRELTRQSRDLLIINDRADIAKASAADGVHLGLDDLPLADARRILGPSKLIGLTAHSLAELRAAESLGPDYIGVGTMFKSPTKPDLLVRGPRELIPAAARCSVPCYAIGGITRSNLPQLLKLRSTRAAVGSAITSAESVAAETKWFVKRLGW
jgi:thiamine-phosphate pyrophosphorylase